jgi:phosphoribosyl 1,2-cyclic phosphodiesterase
VGERARIRLHVLASGSKGNASIVEVGNRAVMVDCGICKRDFFERCEVLGIDVSEIEAVLVTHEHTDHTKGLGVVLRGLAKQDVRPRVITSAAVRAASRDIQGTFELDDQDEMRAGDMLSLAGMQVLAFPTSHDAAESFGFRFQTADDALGYMTDTGVVTPYAHEALASCRLLAIESNHDKVMLAEGDYPWSLKQRIAGEYGHLSNDQSAEEVESLLDARLEQIAVMHISENNNTFGIPVRTMEAMLARVGHTAHVQAGLPRTPLTVE